MTRTIDLRVVGAGRREVPIEQIGLAAADDRPALRSPRARRSRRRRQGGGRDHDVIEGSGSGRAPHDPGEDRLAEQRQHDLAGESRAAHPRLDDGDGPSRSSPAVAAPVVEPSAVGYPGAGVAGS